jgi:acyl-CoA synthetase (AMP-forming)/AMP-acid ligase II
VLKRGDRILFHGQTSLRFPAIYLACHRIGAVAVPVDARMAPAERNELFIQIEPAIALFPGSLETSFAFEELDQGYRYSSTRSNKPFSLKAMRLQIFYLPTGTTGSRKGVQLTHENIFAGAANSNEFIGNSPSR